MFGIPDNLLVAGGILAAGLGVQFWPQLTGVLGGLFKRGGDAESGDTDVLDLQAMKRVQARFERLHCDEGLAAVQTCLQHFFHAPESHS